MDLKRILENCHFVPMSTMKKVIELMEVLQEYDPMDSFCKRNLAKLQQSRMCLGSFDSKPSERKFRNGFQAACCRAIYSHNWNKLLYLLKKCPPWAHSSKDGQDFTPYLRALLILLMYHPTSQAQGLLNDYLHMVWSCRSDADKKAILKILLTLPDKIYAKTYKNYGE